MMRQPWKKRNVPDLAPIELHNGTVLDGHLVRQLSWSGVEATEAWFAALPAMLREYCERWEIALDPTPPALNYNLVLFGTAPAHGPVIIKTCPPQQEATAEIDALTVVSRPGVVPVIHADPTVSIMLQRRVMPGESLHARMERGDIDDERATEIAAGAMRAFSTPVPEGSRLIPLGRWMRAMRTYSAAHPAGDGPIPGEILESALGHADRLLSTSGTPVVVHGDINPGNILWDDDRGWTVIDPKGLIGPLGYDIGTWMINPYGLFRKPDLAAILDRRLDQLAVLLGIDRVELWRWSLVHAVLSECWTLESPGVEPDHLHAIEIARVLMTLPEARR